MEFLIGGIIWVILVFVLASVAKGKGRSYGGFFAIGLFLSPLVGFIILLAMGENKDEVAKQNISSGISRKCPFCANEIKIEAIICQFCGKDLPKIEIPKNIKDLKKGDLIETLVDVKIRTSIGINVHNKTLEIIEKGKTVEFISRDNDQTHILVQTPSGNKGYCVSSDFKIIS